MTNNICFTAKVFRNGHGQNTLLSAYAIRSYDVEWNINDGRYITLKGLSGGDEDAHVTVPAVGDDKFPDHAWRVVIENMEGNTVEVFNYKGDNRDIPIIDKIS